MILSSHFYVTHRDVTEGTKLLSLSLLFLLELPIACNQRNPISRWQVLTVSVGTRLSILGWLYKNKGFYKMGTSPRLLMLRYYFGSYGYYFIDNGEVMQLQLC